MGWARIPRRSRKTLRAALAWTGFWTAFGVLDAVVPVPFSQTIREVFNVGDPRGRRNFLIVLGLASVGFAAHILNK